MGLLKIEKDLDLVKATDGTTLNKLSKTIQDQNVVQTIAYLILRLSEQFNVGKKFTPEQASILAFDILSLHGTETIEDIVLMLKYARQGVIGDGKDFKLDAQTVLHKWMPEYLEKKIEVREQNIQARKGELNGMANFKWDKEAIDNFKILDKPKLSHKTLGQRLKETFGNVPESKPQISREEYINKMVWHIKNQPLKKLKAYLLNNDSNSETYDDVIYEMVEKEVDARNLRDKK